MTGKDEQFCDSTCNARPPKKTVHSPFLLLLDVGTVVVATGVGDGEELLERVPQVCQDGTHGVDVGLEPQGPAVEQPQPGSVDTRGLGGAAIGVLPKRTSLHGCVSAAAAAATRDEPDESNDGKGVRNPSNSPRLSAALPTRSPTSKLSPAPPQIDPPRWPSNPPRGCSAESMVR